MGRKSHFCLENIQGKLDGVIFKSGINDTDLSRPRAQMFDPWSTSPFLVILHMYKMAFWITKEGQGMDMMTSVIQVVFVESETVLPELC